MRLGKLGLGAALGVALAAGSAHAAPERLGVFGDWEAYRVGDAQGRECFVHSVPRESKGDYTRRGEVLAQVSHRPSARVRSELSITAGYTYRRDSEVEVDIDGRKLELFVHEDRAYARDAATDRELARRMKRGRKLVVRGVSARGTRTTDEFSLRGFTAAHAAIDRACPRR